MQCALEGKCSKCDFGTRWERASSGWQQKLAYVAWTQDLNAEGKLTGFVEIMAVAKAPMAIEEWQKLFHCRRASDVADAEDLGAAVDRARADGAVWIEKGERVRGLEDGRWVRETLEEKKRRWNAEGLRETRAMADPIAAFNARQSAQRAAEAAATAAEEEAAAKAKAEAASAALAARATLAVRAAWGGKC
jgi:hypothetical protein